MKFLHNGRNASSNTVSLLTQENILWSLKGVDNETDEKDAVIYNCSISKQTIPLQLIIQVII